jgi:membrane peptidoglycan carboxypeptidase
LYNGKASENRRKLILSNVKENGHITEAEYNAALAEPLEEHIFAIPEDVFLKGAYCPAEHRMAKDVVA